MATEDFNKKGMDEVPEVKESVNNLESGVNMNKQESESKQEPNSEEIPKKRVRFSDTGAKIPKQSSSKMKPKVTKTNESTIIGDKEVSNLNAEIVLARNEVNKSVNKLQIKYEELLQRILKQRELEWAAEKKVLEKKISDEIEEQECFRKEISMKGMEFECLTNKLLNANNLLRENGTFANDAVDVAKKLVTNGRKISNPILDHLEDFGKGLTHDEIK